MNHSLHRVLADQAWRAASIDECPGTTAWKVLYEKKLIEIVVRECLNIAHQEHKNALEFYWDDDTAQTIRNSISEMFGVEE